MKWTALLSCLVCCSAAVQVWAADLVRGGKPAGEFVLAGDATQVEVFAVTDARKWIAEMTGATMPIVSTPTEDVGTKVFVGRNFAEPLFKEDMAALEGSDGYAIRERDGKVYVFGSRPRGTAYGVFGLLERNSDIIWARPHPRYGTIFGRHENLSLTQANLIDKPTFPYRGWGMGHPFHAPSGEWVLRNGGNQLGRGMEEAGWDMLHLAPHNLATPISRLFKDHPEYFAFDPLKGGRHGVTGGEGSMCLTNPKLPEVWAREVIREVHEREARTRRPVDAFLIGPGDNWFTCQCPECLKPIQLPQGGTLEMKDPDAVKDPLFRSTQIFMFLNEAMKTLKQEVPHVKMVSLAYIHMAEPPMVDIHPDMLIYFAPYPTSTMHFGLLDERQAGVWRDRFAKWMTKTKNLGFYEYFFSKPSPLAFYAGENLKTLGEHGMDPSKGYVYTEFDFDRGGPGWDVGAMNTWVIARLFWNPNQDVDALYRYYIQRTYRDAAPKMLEYYELIKNSWVDSGDTTYDNAHTSIPGVYAAMIVKKGLEPRVRQILGEAASMATHPSSQALIRRMSTRYASFTKGLNRMVAPNIQELSHDGDRFESVQWEKPEVLDEFKQTRRYGDILEASQATTLRAAHDGTHLYLRFTASDTQIAKAKARPKDNAEVWPAGDHGEIWFSGPGIPATVFAFDCNGNAYDARGYDRDWNSGWRVVTQKTDDGWEAIAVIPLSALGLQPGVESKLQWTAIREINHGNERPEWVSYRAVPLYSSFFPIIID